MYSATVLRQALELVESGSSLRSVSMATGINPATLREWRDHPEKAQAARSYCPRCGDDPAPPEPHADYAYLLGLYLGDGCISVGGNPAKGIWKLRIICADAWPGLIEECVRAMNAVRPTSRVMLQQKPGYQEVSSYSRHWPCLFPQYGPGRKHLRRIELQPWQQTIVNEFPGEFVKGLFHSDGYRGMNRVRWVLADGEHWYEYPRYLFTNRSPDILGLCGATLDRLEVSGDSLAPTWSRWRRRLRLRGWTCSWARSTEQASARVDPSLERQWCYLKWCHVSTSDSGQGARPVRAGPVRPRGRSDDRSSALNCSKVAHGETSRARRRREAKAKLPAL